LEFPEIGVNGRSLIFALEDCMTISYSVYRNKIRMIPLGNTGITGYGLGTRLVAGSMIRSVFSTDKVTKIQEDLYFANQKEIQERLLGIDSKIPSGLPKEDIISVMKDDLTSFNIHLASTSEMLSEKVDSENNITYKTHSRYEVITGCIILNTGQVFSIEDLLTESTMSFEAKSVKTITDLNKVNYTEGFSNSGSILSVSNIL
jgi:hypothetical protein